MSSNDPFKDKKLQQFQLSIYLIPVLGAIASLWAVSRKQSNEDTVAVSRLALTLTGSWLFSYALLWLGGLQTSDLLSLRLLYLNGLLTSGYFLTCLFFIWQIFQGKKVGLRKK
ncbi:MAG: hypothetical protein VKJ02_06440 [Snowella sp.]|nr:hypothetical protein [Snowella sp.]